MEHFCQRVENLSYFRDQAAYSHGNVMKKCGKPTTEAERMKA